VHDFLSDDWVEAVKEIRNRYADEASPVSYKLRLNQVITAVPFGDGERRIHIDTTDGTMVLDLGELENPDATITTDYDTAKKLFVDQDQAAAMQAFMAGKIKIQGDMTKIMAMQGAPVDEVAKKVADEIKAITA
jgi:putative sterol carrier protein